MAATTGTGCLDETTLTLLVEDRLAATERAATEQHIEGCGSCRQLLGGMMAGGTGGTSGAGRPNVDLAGTMIDRYITECELGFGAMGRVFLAVDPELDRKVAIKLLRRLDPGGDHDLRLRREAQALARIAHPNVAAIYDVGEVDGNLFLAMEYVGGGTLSAWLRAKPRGWQEIVRVFAAAGRGLAAVHARGLIHRDFKPDNVLLDDHGGAKVTDFGLVATLSEHGGGLELGSAEGLDVVGALTVTGAVLGTPAYMSPEQFEGGVVDARSDQFSFCVALYEALYAARPFPGTNVAELKLGLRGPVIEPSTAQRRGAPRWLHQVVLRGLAHDPAQRYPTMDAVVTALGYEQRRKRRTTAAAIVAGAAAIGLATAWIAGGSPDPGCTTAAAELAGTWNPERRATLQAAFATSKLPFAADATAGALAELDRYATRWQASHTQVCEATRVKRTQSTLAMDLRMDCLARRRRELAIVIDVLGTATPEIVEHAVDAVAGLPSVGQCDDVAGLSGVAPLPSDRAAREEIEAARAALARADVWIESGQYALAKPVIDAQVAVAGRLGYAPLEGEALLMRGRLEDGMGDFTSSLASYRGAAASSDRGRDDRTRFVALARLVQALAGSGKPTEAEAQLPAVGAALDRAGHEPEQTEIWLAARGMVHYLRGQHADAVKVYQEAIASARARGDQRATGNLLQGLVIASTHSTDPTTTLPWAEESLAIAVREYGERHPDVAERELDVARIIRLQGKDDDALARAQHARALQVAVYGEDHPAIARTDLTLANMLRRSGHPVEARDLVVRSLEVLRATYGEEHFYVAEALRDLAFIERGRQQFEVALGYAQQSRAILERTLGPETDGLVAAYHTISMLQRDLNRPADAEASLKAGLELGMRIAPDNPQLALFQAELGSIRLEAQDAAGGEHWLELAVATFAKTSSDPEYLAFMRLDLAVAKGGLGKWDEALELGTLAKAALTTPEGIAEADRTIAGAKKHLE